MTMCPEAPRILDQMISEGSLDPWLYDLQPISYSNTWYLHGWGLCRPSQLGSRWGGAQAPDAAYLSQVGSSSCFWMMTTGLTVMAGQEASWPSS